MLDLLLRGAAIGAGALIFLLLAMRNPKPAGTVSIGAGWLTISGYLIVSAPSSAQLYDWAYGLARILATVGPLALTVMVLDLLARRTPWRTGMIALATLVAVLGLVSEGVPLASAARSGLVIVLYVSIVGLAWRADQDDLVAGRRVFRRVFIAAMGAFGVVISSVEVSGIVPGPQVMIAQAFGILTFVVAFGLYALAPRSDLWARAGQSNKVLDTGHRSLIAAKLEQQMETGVWRKEGLTIGALAEDLCVPEHQLRKTINHELGYRNFSTFVNQARISAAKSMLVDPKNAGTTVLEIAFSVGFASLGPFNRAFRAETGQNPTEFRSNARSKAPTEKKLTDFE